MRKIIIGLGNPGKDYEKTRHNAGFMFVDYLLDKLKDKEILPKKLKDSLIIRTRDDLVLVKPQTFMNDSGLAVKDVVKWLDVDIEKELILVHDDLDIPLGKYKLQFVKSPKDHKGVKSVEDHLGTVEFYRLRIGVDNRGDKKMDGDKYVLQRFGEEELIEIVNVFELVDINKLYH